LGNENHTAKKHWNDATGVEVSTSFLEVFLFSFNPILALHNRIFNMASPALQGASMGT